MTTFSQKVPITHRDFFECGVGAVGLLANINSVKAERDPGEKTDGTRPDTMPTPGKIALEEHFDFPETENLSYAALGTPEFRRQIADMGSDRIAEMGRGGVEVCILSLVGPGIQAIPNNSQAISVARHANDDLAEQIQKNPKRLKGFAALPMQDPKAAAQELTRCVKELGFCSAMVNGFTQTGEAKSIAFYDQPQFRDFWATVQQ